MVLRFPYKSLDLLAEIVKVLFALFGFSSGSVVKNLLFNAGDTETRVRSLGWEDPLNKEMQSTPAFLPEFLWIEEPGRATVHAVTKSQTQLSSHMHTHTTWKL